jgi:hypothetical protein
MEDKYSKTPSQKLRFLIFAMWNVAGTPDTFDEYYVKVMDKIMDGIKKKLETGEYIK